jgi:hypothetical protein
MSTLFKKNSRFDALADDFKEIQNKKKNSNKNDKKNINENDKKNINVKDNDNNKFISIFKENKENSFLREDYVRRTNKYETKEEKEKREQKEKARKEYIKKKAEEELLQNLAQENFPDLCTINKQSNNPKPNYMISYIEKASHKPIKEVKTSVTNVKPGWVEIKYDKTKNNKIVYTYGEGVCEDTQSNELFKYNIPEALVALHNKRTQEYIDMWGYETWEKMFQFPNYDYEYFDKLDEKYEKEMENETEKEIIYDNDENYY